MLQIAGGVLLAVAVVVLLPYLLYWLVWFFTGRGLPRKTEEQLENARKKRRAEEIWALKAVGIAAIAVGIYKAAMFLWTR
jgi:hypothetical protein